MVDTTVAAEIVAPHRTVPLACTTGQCPYEFLGSEGELTSKNCEDGLYHVWSYSGNKTAGLG